MEENNKDCIYYLEQNKNTGDSSFNNEVNSLEFVQKIGDMEFNKDYKKRDLFLKKLGEKLFKKLKKRKQRKTNKLNIEIRRETRILTQEDIDNLLIAVDANINRIDLFKINFKLKLRWFFIHCSEWKIIFSKNNIVYKFSIKGIEKIDYNRKNNETENPTLNKNRPSPVLSDEEINKLLEEIKNWRNK